MAEVVAEVVADMLVQVHVPRVRTDIHIRIHIRTTIITTITFSDGVVAAVGGIRTGRGGIGATRVIHVTRIARTTIRRWTATSSTKL